MHTSVQMTLTVSLILDELVNKLLTKTVIRDGKEVEVERIMPFRLKYRLSRNKATLDKDYKAYQQKQLMYLARYGELTADGTHFEIRDPEKLEFYKRDMEAALSTVLDHTVVKVDAEDLENLKDDAGLNDLPEHLMHILQAYLVEDDEFLDDITSEIRWNTYQPKEPTPIETAVALTQAVAETPIEEPKQEEVKEEPKVEEPKKKTPAKKKTAEPKGEEPKAEEPVKPVKKKAPAKTAEKAIEPVKAPAKKKTTKTTEVKAEAVEVKPKKPRTKKTTAEVAEVKDKE